MANFNYNDPRYQRDIQRAQAKGNATGNIARTEPVSARHAAYQLGRQEQFKSLAIQSSLNKTQYDLNLARFKQADRNRGLRNEKFNLFKRATNDKLDSDKENMNWTIGLGIGQLGYGAIEGVRRRKIIESELEQNNRFNMLYERQIGQDIMQKYENTHGPY